MEGAARLLISRPHLPHLSMVFERGPYRAVIMAETPRGVAAPVRNSTNRWGLRGDDPPADWEEWETWIAVGSSTTQCYSLDDDRTWPQQVQRRLRAAGSRTWVGNAGQDGATTRSAVALVDEVMREVRPTGMLFLVGGIDMVLSLSDDRRREGSPHDHALRRRLDRFREARRSGLRGILRGDGLRLRDEFVSWRRSRRAHTVPAKSPHRGRFPPALTAPEDTLPPLNLLLPSLPEYRANLKRLGALARELGARAVFLTQPILYGTDSAWASREARTLRIEGRDYRISAATERRLLERFNAATLEVCAEEELECLDLATRIPPDSLLFYDEGHFTDSGAALAAEAIAGYLSALPKETSFRPRWPRLSHSGPISSFRPTGTWHISIFRDILI